MSNCLDYEASLMIDVMGAEEFLAKVDGSHTIVFSATYGFSPGSGLYHEQLAQRQIQMVMLFDSPKRQSQSGTRRDLHT
jgi:hypothetical protein